MPPKGWRKNAEGQYPQPTRPTLVSIDDILFPKSTVQKLAKEMVQDESSNMIISKDSLLALQRSATVFVSHVLFHARQHSKAGLRKTVNVQDIYGALEDAEFSGFLPDIKQRLAAFEERKKLEKDSKQEERGEDNVKMEEDGEDGKVENAEQEEKVNPAEKNESDEEPEILDVNPIAAISKEEMELGGRDEEDVNENEEDDNE